MKFKIQVNITPEDYLEFNKVVMSETPMGKKSTKLGKIIFGATCFVLILFSLIVSKFSIEGFKVAICLLVAFVVAQCLMKPINNVATKATVKSLTKVKGKKPYSEKSVLEFYDDVFVEISEDAKNEVKYSAVENTIINEKFIALFVNSIQAYIIPVHCFESEEQKNSLIEFLNERKK